MTSYFSKMLLWRLPGLAQFDDAMHFLSKRYKTRLNKTISANT